MNKCKNKKPYNPLPEYLTIGPSSIHGAGILAKEDIPGEVVIGISHVYDPNFQHDYIRTPLGGFLNHGDDPNCYLEVTQEWDNYIVYNVFTSRKIKKDEELILNYEV